MILRQVDRSVDMGKRDYAIILLGATTGLRAVDIVNMKLRDIHWRNGEIHVVQQKTGDTLSLPLMPQVGDAYISLDSEHLKAIEKAMSLQNPLKDAYCAPQFDVNDDDVLKRLYGLK